MIRFAILYFAMLVLFLVLLIAPLVARTIGISLPEIPMGLLQPLDGGSKNNDTITDYTGNGLPKGFHAASFASSSAA